jgi:hypothetical protein
MKAQSTVRKHLRALRCFIEDSETPIIDKRIAYEIETAIRWAREDVVGWEPPVQQAATGGMLLRRELEKTS